MVAEILLHIGMHKTGTTALQTALAGYDDGRIRYARLGHPNHSVPFVTSFASEPHRYHVWKRIGASPELVAQKRANLRAKLDHELALPHRRLLVVGEEISLLPSAAVRAMTAHLTQGNRRLSILAYLRDPLGYVTSAFQQQVRGGQRCFTLPRPYYRQRFEKFITLLGPDAVTFRAYAPERFVGHSVITDYAAVAGLPPDALTDQRANISLPLDAVRLIHLLNRTGPAARTDTELAARSALIRHLADSFATRFSLDPAIAASVVDRDELAWIEDTARIPLGPQTASVDPAKAETALADMICAIPPAALDRLRTDLTLRNIAHGGTDDAASLIGKLYLAFVLAEDLRRATPLRSASG